MSENQENKIRNLSGYLTLYQKTLIVLWIECDLLALVIVLGGRSVGWW